MEEMVYLLHRQCARHSLLAKKVDRLAQISRQTLRGQRHHSEKIICLKNCLNIIEIISYIYSLNIIGHVETKNKFFFYFFSFFPAFF